MENVINTNNLNDIANTLSHNGIENTLIAMMVLFLIAFILFFIGIFTLILKTNTSTTNKLLQAFDENQKKDREMQVLKFNENSEHLKELTIEMQSMTKEMRDLGQRYNNTIDNVNTLLEMQNDKTIKAIIEDKPMSLRDFDKQSKQIIKSIVLESVDYVLEIISGNSLYKNKQNIATKILLNFQHNLQMGANTLDGLPFREDTIKQKLFFKIEEYMKVAYEKMVKALDVEEKYDREMLDREIRAIREDFINKVNSLRFIEL